MTRRKIYFMNSALSIPRTFSCALDTFLERNIVFVFFHINLSNLAVTIEFTELLCSKCSRYCWNYCHFISCRSCFRPEVSLRIIVKCNVNWQGSEMENHVQPIGIVFITMREWFPCHLKEVRVLVNELSVVKSFYFYTKISRLIQKTKLVK